MLKCSENILKFLYKFNLKYDFMLKYDYTAYLSIKNS